MSSVRIPGIAYRLLAEVRRGLQTSKQGGMFLDSYELWRARRPLGAWDRGAAPEAMELLGKGNGKLYANGAGGPRTTDVVISLESAYRFRAHRSITDPLRRDGYGEPETAGCYLVVNRARLFVLDMVKPEDIDDLLVDCYLSELIGKPVPPLPEGAP